MDDGQRALRSESTPPTPPSRLARTIDGGRTWGSLDTWPNKYGFRKYRLVVFPPGISPTERRYLRVARSWPTWGAALWLVLAVGLSGHGAGWTAVAYPTVAFLVSGAITFALARDLQANTRAMTAAVIAGYDDPAASAQFAHLHGLARTLLAADTMLDRGELTLVEYEAVWWMVYDALGQDTQNHV